MSSFNNERNRIGIASSVVVLVFYIGLLIFMKVD